MNPLTAVIVVLVLLAATTIIGITWRRRTGRVREVSAETVSAGDIGADTLGERATLLQFSTEFCSPCRATHAMLLPIAAERTGVAHIDVDLSLRPRLATRFGIAQTPTVLLLDAAGTIRARIGGAPRRDELVARLDDLVKEHRVSA